jgi:hypothetical protein
LNKKETVEVTLKLPAPIFNFYTALADSENKSIQKMLVEELIRETEAILDNEETKLKALVVHQCGLEKVLE